MVKERRSARMGAVPRRPVELASRLACCAAAVRLRVTRVGRRHGRVRKPASRSRRPGGPARACWDPALAVAAASLWAATAVAASSADHRGGLAGRRCGPSGGAGAGLRRWTAWPGRRHHRGRCWRGRVDGRVGYTWTHRNKTNFGSSVERRGSFIRYASAQRSASIRGRVQAADALQWECYACVGWRPAWQTTTSSGTLPDRLSRP
jgi:hypothetical protein